MIDVVVLVPVLGRPHRVAPLLESLEASCAPPSSGVRVATIFLCSPGDDTQIAAVRAMNFLRAGHLVVEWEAGPGDYARKLNRGFQFAVTGLSTDWIFLGADDLAFHPGWLEAALATREATGACVIGSNDLGNSNVIAGHHATHSLVHADYAACGTVDEAGKILHEGYDHQYVDNEFVGTAKWRGTFAPSAACHVEHNHPFWGKGTMDATYEKALRASRQDQELYLGRRHLWGSL